MASPVTVIRLRNYQTILLTVAVFTSGTPQAQQPFEGVWILDRVVEETPAQLTAAGQRIQQAYDLLHDDPSLRCEPASLGRIWGNPNTRTGIHVVDGDLQIEHELFDIRRSPSATGAPAAPVLAHNLQGTEFTALGQQSYLVDGERLRITSTGHTKGYIRTGTGYPQGDGGSATETFWRDGDHLMLELVYRDPTLFDGEYRILHQLSSTGEAAVPVYSCTDGDYDWFEQLNAEAIGGAKP